jgi:hypothetical protein
MSSYGHRLQGKTRSQQQTLRRSPPVKNITTTRQNAEQAIRDVKVSKLKALRKKIWRKKYINK